MARARPMGIPVIDESEAEAKISVYENNIMTPREKELTGEKQETKKSRNSQRLHMCLR
jgi:hypothetical protein